MVAGLSAARIIGVHLGFVVPVLFLIARLCPITVVCIHLVLVVPVTLLITDHISVPVVDVHLILVVPIALLVTILVIRKSRVPQGEDADYAIYFFYDILSVNTCTYDMAGRHVVSRHVNNFFGLKFR